MRLSLRQKLALHLNQGGFTLIEMIMVMVITGILGFIVAQAINFPVRGYLDSARRADMTDIADTAMRRMIRDLRYALPNSVRIYNSSGNNIGSCGTAVLETCYLEFIPTKGAGSYISTLPASGVNASFLVMGNMPTYVSGEALVFNNATSAVAYSGSNVAAVSSVLSSDAQYTTFNISTPANFSPPATTENRFQVVTMPVTYVCSPVTGGTGGTLSHYWDYATLPELSPPTPPASAPSATPPSPELLANHVSACSFTVNPSGLVTLILTISETDTSGGTESISMSDSAYVANTKYP